jgi:hypothetical protein
VNKFCQKKNGKKPQESCVFLFFSSKKILSNRNYQPRWFIDKHVSRAVGNHFFSGWRKSYRIKSFLNKVTVSDIASSIIVYENTKVMWEEDLVSSRAD